MMGGFSVAALLLACAAVAAALQTTQEADKSLARLVPADVGLFAEIVGGEDLLIPLTEPDIWLTLAELAGQPARPQDTQEWREQIRQTIGMEPAEAIRLLFSDRVAFVGAGPARSRDGVVICRPAGNLDHAELAKRWSAQPQPAIDGVMRYRLKNQLGLAATNGTLVFGDGSPAGRMFQHVVASIAARTGPRLSDDPVYQALLSRVPPGPQGIVFGRLDGDSGKPRQTPVATTQPAATQAAEAIAPANAAGPAAESPASTQPSPAEAAPTSTQPSATSPGRRALPQLFSGATAILMALHRDKNLLHFSAVADGRVEPTLARGDLAAQLAQLPARTLLAWGGHLDYEALAGSGDKLPPRNLLRILLRTGRGAARFAGSVQSATCLAVGAVTPSRAPETPPVPAVGAIIATADPGSALEAFEDLVKAGVAVYNLMGLAPGADLPRLTEINSTAIEGRAAWSLDLTPVAARLGDASIIGELHLAWAVDDTALVVATHEDWLRQILAARHGVEPRLADVLQMGKPALSPGTRTIVVVQAGPIADLGELWLKHFEKRMPQVLDEKWWRERQPGGPDVWLGIMGTEDAENRRLKITSVDARGPAAGVIEPGDDVVGLNGRRFATSQPVEEFRREVAGRSAAQFVEVWVERGGMVRTVRLALPFVNPVDALRRAVAVGRVAQRVVFHDDMSEESAPRGYMTVELREAGKRLFDFPLAPAVEPVGAPTPATTQAAAVPGG